MASTTAGPAAPFVSDVLAREGTLWVRAASTSMAPLIRAGDALRLVPLDHAGARAGMVVAFRRGDELVVHRVLRCASAGPVTKGDALPEPEAPLAPRDLVGRVVAVRTPRGRTRRLDGPVSARVERWLAALAARAPRHPMAWKAHRLPFHLLALVRR